MSLSFETNAVLLIFNCSCLFLPDRSVSAGSRRITLHPELLRKPGGARPRASANQHGAKDRRRHAPGVKHLSESLLESSQVLPRGYFTTPIHLPLYFTFSQTEAPDKPL